MDGLDRSERDIGRAAVCVGNDSAALDARASICEKWVPALGVFRFIVLPQLFVHRVLGKSSRSQGMDTAASSAGALGRLQNPFHLNVFSGRRFGIMFLLQCPGCLAVCVVGDQRGSTSDSCAELLANQFLVRCVARACRCGATRSRAHRSRSTRLRGWGSNSDRADEL